MLSTRLLTGCATALVATLLTGCGSGGDGKSASVTPAASAELPEAQSDDPALGVSPGGVTTAVNAPAESTEEQYAQACLAAKRWMSAQGGDPDDLVEPLLKEVQASPDSSPVTFRKTWAELLPPQQAAVIIAVRAATEGGC